MENIVCEMKDGIPVSDYHDCIGFIKDKTGLSEKDIENVLDAESEYMIKCGIIE